MGAYLDLDDLAADNPEAKSELREIRDKERHYRSSMMELFARLSWITSDLESDNHEYYAERTRELMLYIKQTLGDA